MISMKTLSLLAAGASLAVVPVAASAAQASIDGVRAVSTTEGESHLFGNDHDWVFAVLALAAVVGGILLLTDNDDAPVSP